MESCERTHLCLPWYFVLLMNQQVSDSRVGPYGCGDAMPLYILATASETPSTYEINTDVVWSADLGLGLFFLTLFFNRVSPDR